MNDGLYKIQVIDKKIFKISKFKRIFWIIRCNNYSLWYNSKLSGNYLKEVKEEIQQMNLTNNKFNYILIGNKNDNFNYFLSSNFWFKIFQNYTLLFFLHFQTFVNVFFKII